MKINLLNAFPGDDPTCKRIPLTQGQAQLVSPEDFDRLSQDKWQAAWDPTKKSFYAVRTVQREGKRITLRAHREIIGLEPGDPREVHHKDGDTLNNTRENLEVLTVSEHKDRHRHEPRKNASMYGVGVYRQPSSGRFSARAWVDSKLHCIGTFDTPEEAQKARSEFLTNRREETPSV